MPSILVVHPSAELYGSDRQMAESVAGFVEAGWSCTVCLPEHGALEHLLPGARVEIAPFTVLRKALISPRGLAGLLARLPGDLTRAVRLIRSLRPDVVYVSTVTIPCWVLAARLAGVRTVVHVHEAESEAPVVHRVALNGPLLLAGTVIANSAASRDVVVATVGRLAGRTVVVPNGIADPGVAAHSAPANGRLVLVARLSPRKGIDVALEAVARVRANGVPVTLEVCGTAFAGYEWFERQVRSRAQQPDLAGAVTFRGYVSPTAPSLAAADIVLVPSRVEPFGNTAVEGLLAARPVIASDVQGLAEIITDGVTGLLVPPGDVSALAEAILRLRRDPELADRVARAGRSDAQDRFSVSRYRREIVATISGPVEAAVA